MNPGGTPTPFAVTYRAGLVDRLRHWAAVARRFGTGAAFLAAIREAERELRTRPREWGDPLYQLHRLSLTMYVRSTPLLLFRYAVHETQPVVFVQHAALMPRALFSG